MVGCGFGGLAAARTLARYAPANWEVLAFNRTPVLYNYPLLPRLLIEPVATHWIDRPLERLLGTQRIVLHTRRVESIDIQRGCVHAGTETHRYDGLILAPGGRAIPLDQEEGFGVCYPKAARHLMRLREEMERLAANATDRRERYRFVVVGGGLTGIEFAASLRLGLDQLCQRHRADRDAFAVSLVEQRDRIAPGCHPKLSETLERHLRRLRIEVRTGCRVQRVARDHLQTRSGTLPADRVLCCIGSRPDLRLDLTGVEHDAGGIPVRTTLQSVTAENLFVIGDAMRSETPRHQETKRASHAIRQGRAAAKNLLRLMRGEPPAPYQHPILPTLVSLGMHRAVMEYRGRCLAGALPARIKHYLETRC
ncbi:MAG: NAD(P)/FAD-dependent oxidoreductase [Gammaproteobacteria bacterium]